MLEIVAGSQVHLTPFGTYYAVTEEDVSDAHRRVLQAILCDPGGEPLSEARACRWTGCADPASGLDFLRRLQSMTMIESGGAPDEATSGPLDGLLADVLAPLSGSGSALLADDQGFHLAATGFHADAVEELAALSADIAMLHTRHAGLLGGRLGIQGSSWGLLDPAGASQIGIWPLYIGRHHFALAIAGRPRLNQQAFCRLARLLALRYGAPARDDRARHPDAPPGARNP